MEAGKAGNFDRESSAVSSAPPAAAKAERWYRRVSFWRAVAGMAFAIALACAMVAAEFSSALITRASRYHQRLRQLSSNLSAMRGKIANADRELAGLRTAAEVDDSLRTIIAQPDARLIRLQAPGRAAAPNGIIALSPSLRRAAVALAGLPARGGATVLTLWWTRGQRPPLRAARISIGAANRAGLVVALPDGAAAITGAIVTTDADPATAKPSASIVLEGTVAAAAAAPPPSRRKGG